MALVIFFVENPAKCVAEMVRVVSRGGTVAAYVWDILDGGVPHEPIQSELHAMGYTPTLPPSAGASRTEALWSLWTGAGLDVVKVRQITVRRTFANFEDFWTSNLIGSSIASTVTVMDRSELELLKSRVCRRLMIDAIGGIRCDARANAVWGRVP